MAVTLRRATLGDIDHLRRWDEKPHVIAATTDNPAVRGFDIDWQKELPRTVPWREFLIAEIEGRPIGMVQIIDPAEEETHYWGAVAPNLRAIDIWIGEEEDLGRGYGTEMMQLVHERCFADPAVKAIVIDPLASNTRAHRFYERLGYKLVERRSFDDDSDCFVYRLEADAQRR